MGLPQFKHGKFCRDMPEQFAAKVKVALENQELLTMTEDVAVLDVRLSELLSRALRSDTPAFRERLRESWHRVRDEFAGGNADSVRAALSEHGKVIEDTDSGDDAWAQIYHVMSRKAALIALEHKRRQAEKLLIPVERASQIMTAIGLLIKENVKDEMALRAIAAGMDRLIGRRDRPRPPVPAAASPAAGSSAAANSEGAVIVDVQSEEPQA